MGGKVYLVLLILVNALLIIPDFSARTQSPRHLLDLGITTVSIIGVFGYAFEKKIGHAHFWKAWLFILVPWDIWSNFATGYIFPPQLLVLALLMIFLIPEYIMIYRYGFQRAPASG